MTKTPVSTATTAAASMNNVLASRFSHGSVDKVSWQYVARLWRELQEFIRGEVGKPGAGDGKQQRVLLLDCYRAQALMAQRDVAEGEAIQLPGIRNWQTIAKTWKTAVADAVSGRERVMSGESSADDELVAMSHFHRHISYLEAKLDVAVDDKEAAEILLKAGARMKTDPTADLGSRGAGQKLQTGEHPLSGLTYEIVAQGWQDAALNSRGLLLAVDRGERGVDEADIIVREQLDRCIEQHRYMDAKDRAMEFAAPVHGRAAWIQHAQSWRSVAFSGAYSFDNIRLRDTTGAKSVQGMDDAIERIGRAAVGTNKRVGHGLNLPESNPLAGLEPNPVAEVSVAKKPVFCTDQRLSPALPADLTPEESAVAWKKMAMTWRRLALKAGAALPSNSAVATPEQINLTVELADGMAQANIAMLALTAREPSGTAGGAGTHEATPTDAPAGGFRQAAPAECLTF